VGELQGIRGLPAVVVTEFEREGQPREATLKALRPQQRQQVQEALAQYHGAVAGASLWPVIGALAGGWLAWLLFAMPAIPVAIVGLVLTRKRKVGRCSLCGYAFDRT
jgi:hypothetical protein